MRVTDAVTDRIRQRREKLERAGKVRRDFNGAAALLHLWQANVDGAPIPLSEPSELPGIDIIAIPAGKFLREDFRDTPQVPEHERIRMFAHLPAVPQRVPASPPLIDAPASPYSEPEIAQGPSMPKASATDPARPAHIEIDKEAVLIDLAKARAERGVSDKPTVREQARELVERARKKQRHSHFPSHDEEADSHE